MKAVPNINCDYTDNCENHLRNCWFCDRNEDVTITQDNYSLKKVLFPVECRTN